MYKAPAIRCIDHEDVTHTMATTAHNAVVHISKLLREEILNVPITHRNFVTMW